MGGSLRGAEVWVVFAVAMAAGLGVVRVPVAEAGCADAELPVTSGEVQRLRDASACLINAARAAQGLEALARDTRLEGASQEHADDMVARQYADHGQPDEVSQRSERAGYQWGFIAETIGAGFATPHAIVDGWLKSSEHCAIALSYEPRDIGIGVRADSTAGSGPGTWSLLAGRTQSSDRPKRKDAACPSTLPPGATDPPAMAAPAAVASAPGAPAPAARVIDADGLVFVGRPRHRRGSRVVVVRLRCTRAAGRCRAALRVAHGKTLLARGAARAAANRTVTVRLRLTKRGVARLRSAGRLRVRLIASPHLQRRITLRA